MPNYHIIIQQERRTQPERMAQAISSIGIGVGGSAPWYGTIRNVRIGQRGLSSSELQAITK